MCKPGHHKSLVPKGIQHKQHGEEPLKKEKFTISKSKSSRLS